MINVCSFVRFSFLRLIYINTMIFGYSYSISHVSNLVFISVRFVLVRFTVMFLVFLDCEHSQRAVAFLPLFLFLALCFLLDWTPTVLRTCCTFLLSISAYLLNIVFISSRSAKTFVVVPYGLILLDSMTTMSKTIFHSLSTHSL